ncbi:geranylgeranylglyceryl/heptaprenylglyceryl phosphate synthase [Ammoniphilus oxalaticus]|uniref:Heptaprenylglyceryl phosphate synthase n=1 Tax=Ammoniphilus oxalaticus TaxID=66863 RepID=A0A419SD91_9BACL|nr:heptaprenylglyceryl phosphate synthase [Ammoniphilus oxalaticus]RKD21079.1 geranylgeranylglyceryl/heptaprenylglyceryl phosphate synthase [Ammoniphilus oxalaticus]
MIEYKEWRHVFKLDPDKNINDEDLERICESGTDAVIVGGTLRVSFDNTIDLLARIRRFSVPCILEVSNVEAVVPGFDFYFVPLVLNAGNEYATLHHHTEGLKQYGSLVKWSEVAVEGYIIFNPQSEVAKLTGAKIPKDVEDVKALARLADQMLKLPIVYIEYSGAYGDPSWVQSVRSVIEQAHLFYGGGIKDGSQAAEMAKWADTVIVGNIIYEDIEQALKTVHSVKSLT